MELRFLLVGGGSGGHAFPLAAIARALVERGEAQGHSVRILMMGAGGRDGFLARAAQEYGFAHTSIIAGKTDRSAFRLPWEGVKTCIGFIQALWRLLWFMPDAVISKGGYDSFAPSLAARLYFIPLFLHESDTIPGSVQRILAPFARGVFLGFSEAQRFFGKVPTLVTGNPVRPDISAGDRARALATFHVADGIPTLLVLGGSQGAQQINDIILSGIAEMTETANVIHQCGTVNHPVVQTERERLIRDGAGSYGDRIAARYAAVPFLDGKDLADAYALADVVVARAGAGTLAELLLLGKPAVVVPLAWAAHGHQLANATAVAQFGVRIVEGENITPHILMNQIRALLNPEERTRVSALMRTGARPDAAAQVADAVLKSIL
ncbi:MAG: UDP-N-acetylglucosamine--N-acetylmuramyl-(pentapeptide) pyrophosphoryl-undecaprenol N-acetylglucosamine transferase [Candidatus Paceibacterota bacterium]|nr:MAG: UDP-N-acetylglucosamine--N-acetylmuramyl-(pentapeptide) pyrophosphoryl-undecaprenol N-acetylglucosamine transferase [Candidatus Paceibacterota bacterium]